MTSKVRAKTGRKAAGRPDFTEQRKEEVRALYAALDEWEREQAPTYIAEMLARYDKYHGRNPLFIAMQRPDATDVDSYKAWTERGRRVMGHGYGIKITYPGPRWYSENPDDPDHPIEHIEYRITQVFDISNTVEDTPEEIAKWKEAHPDGQW